LRLFISISFIIIVLARSFTTYPTRITYSVALLFLQIMLLMSLLRYTLSLSILVEIKRFIGLIKSIIGLSVRSAFGLRDIVGSVSLIRYLKTRL
jgi:hypothetical protein